MHHLLAPVVLAVVLLTACEAEPDPSGTAAPDPTVANVLTDTLTLGDASGEAARDTVPARVQALNVALDSLEAFVVVLEQVEGPVAAWNRAGDAARLLRYLEQNSHTFALDMSQEEAMERYPEQMRRLNALEARRTEELERISQDGVTGRVLAEEMAKADAATQAAGQ